MKNAFGFVGEPRANSTSNLVQLRFGVRSEQKLYTKISTIKIYCQRFFAIKFYRQKMNTNTGSFRVGWVGKFCAFIYFLFFTLPQKN